MSSGTSGSSPEPTRYDRDSPEFGRVLAFSDGLFAIAMTLLVVGIGVPSLSDENSVSELADALNDLTPALISFFISFAVIGRYWLAHHQFFSLLKAIDPALIRLNVVYLGFIAFLPFPTALLGELFSNPLSVVTYAVAVAIVSGMEVVLFRRAHHDGLIVVELRPEVYRWGVLTSLSPVLFFLLSVPVAFLSTTLAVCMWLLVIPFQLLIDRWRPEDAEAQLGLKG
ncbi:TMEM175 family protein [soil metagenome]